MNRTEGQAILITGIGGSGKTLFGSRCLKELPHTDGAIAYDREGDVTKYLRDEISIGRAVVVKSWEDGFKVSRQSAFNPPRIAIFVGKPYADHFLYAASRKESRDLTIYVDESEDLFSQRDALKDQQQEILRVCRNKNNEVIFSAQRPQHISTEVRSQAKWIVCFRQGMTQNIEALGACAEESLWMPSLAFEPHQALVRPSWTKRFDSPLYDFDALNDPIPFRLDPEELALWMQGPTVDSEEDE
jgi:hypothetical protein